MSSSTSSATITGACGSSDSLVQGLKFGKKIYFEDGASFGRSVKGASEFSSSESAAKKVRSVAAMQNAARCQVEGCNVDLSGSKAYYCRHKVCAMHSKAPTVMVGGLQQRFCQQCSRFHQLPEFDQGKRSCRRRLADHNERRRKPPAGTLPSRNLLLSPCFQEENKFRGFVMDFAHPKLPAGTVHQPWQIGQVTNHDCVPDNYWHIKARGALPVNFAPQVDHRLRVHSSSVDNFFRVPGMSSQQCVSGGSETCCALSLLSTEPWSSSSTTSSRSHQTAMVSTDNNFERSGIDQPAITNNCIANYCSFKLQEGSSTSNSSIAQTVGFGQVSHTSNGNFSGELELALQGSRDERSLDPGSTCGHSNSMFLWSL